MEPDFWHERWARGEIGFHQHDFNAHMQAFVGRLSRGPGGHILVPLCGKSRDLIWLMRRGYRVTGVEISEKAVIDFFAENGLTPDTSSIAGGRLFSTASLEILCTDFFALEPGQLPRIDAVYDRAALVALPPGMRERYANRLTALVEPGVRTLLVTLDYPQHEMRGPPFSVPPAEVYALFGETCQIETLHSEDCLAQEPRFRQKGLTALSEHVLLLERAA
jgi:thiopurine S-methyltransferase